MKTVAIIGGGPAGATAAEALARAGATVTVFEEKLGWEKPCGGGLSHKALRRYPFLLEAARGGQCVRDAEFVASDGRAVRFRLRVPLAIYARATLNGLLLDRARAAGAAVTEDRIYGLGRSRAAWTLQGRSGSYRSDYLILAAGARSRLRSFLTEDLGAEDFMLTFGYFVPGSAHLLRVQFFENFEGYAWAFPRLDHASVGICAKVGEDRMSGLRERLHGFMERFGYRAESAPLYSHLLPSLAVERWSTLRLAGDGWALIGDAAGLVDPLTGEGIYYALRSGELLAEALREGSPGRYAERVQKEFRGLSLGARLAPLFYRDNFLGRTVSTRMMEYASRSRSFFELLQDLIDGSQSYPGLAARLYRTLAASFFELVGSSAGQALDDLSVRRRRLSLETPPNGH